MNVIQAVVDEIEIPDSAYEKAKARYEDLGKWLCRSGSSCQQHNPDVFPQGSFLLGTVVRPLSDEEDYDLDLACKLREEVSKASHTQEEVKEIVGGELEAYRTARGIKEDLEEKRRCWRLLYQDEMRFHMDIVPCIPEEAERRTFIRGAMIEHGSEEDLAQEVAHRTVAITDNEHENYSHISKDWNVSNPQGYGWWFRSRVRLAEQSIKDRLRLEMKGSVEELPTYKLKAPLQRCVQLLKRHRDVMFENEPDRQLISIIITTLAAEAYRGEEDVAAALGNILDTMADYVNSQVPRIPNPVNPEEDFADRWYTEEGRRLDLEGNFKLWLYQAKADFQYLIQSRDVDGIAKKASEALDVGLDRDRLQSEPWTISASVAAAKKHHIEKQPKPWGTL